MQPTEDLKEQINGLQAEYKQLQKDYVLACRENKFLKQVLASIGRKLTRSQRIFLEKQLTLYNINI